MVALKKYKPSDRRNALYRKIAVGLKQLGVDGDDLRDMLADLYDVQSRANLTERQLVEFIEHLKEKGFKDKPKKKAPARAKSKNLSDGKTHTKARALWISLYHLGVIDDPSEPALGVFVKRQAKVDNIRFMTPKTASSVIGALEGWATREAGVCWKPYATMTGSVDYPRARVMEAQWRILYDLGRVRTGNTDALSVWVQKFTKSPRVISHIHIGDEDADRVIEALGRMIRKAKADKS